MTSRPHRVLLALLALLLVGAVSNPGVPSTPTGRVMDEVGVMSTLERDDLEARLAGYEQASGHQIVVWIGSTAGDEPIEELAVDAFATWKLGKSGLDDGLALFVLVDDQKVRIEVGYGLEDRVTDLVAAQIIRDVIVPHIAEGDFDAAVRHGVEAVVDTIEGHPQALDAGTLRERGPPPEEPLGLASWVGIGIAGFVFLILLFTRPQLALMLLWSFVGGIGNRRGGGGGGGGFAGRGGRSGGGGATGGW